MKEFREYYEMVGNYEKEALDNDMKEIKKEIEEKNNILAKSQDKEEIKKLQKEIKDLENEHRHLLLEKRKESK